MGDPLCGNSSFDHLVLDTRDVADKTIANAVHTIEYIGQKQYDAYTRESLIDQVRPISDPIKRNNIPLFTTTPSGVKSISQQQVSSLKSDCIWHHKFEMVIWMTFFNMKINHIPQLCPRWVLVRPGRLLGRSCSCPSIWQHCCRSCDN